MPEEILQRFRTMRDYDHKLRRYATELCASIPEEANLSGIESRLDALELVVVEHSQRLTVLETQVATLLGGYIFNITWQTVATTPYAVTGHRIGLLVSSSVGAITINLPSAAAYNGETIYIKDNDGSASTNNITVVPDGAQTIDGDASLTIDGDYSGVQIKSDGTDWKIV